MQKQNVLPSRDNCDQAEALLTENDGTVAVRNREVPCNTWSVWESVVAGGKRRRGHVALIWREMIA